MRILVWWDTPLRANSRTGRGEGRASCALPLHARERDQEGCKLTSFDGGLVPLPF